VVWRLCAAKYAATTHTGEGARLYGGRWSPPGIALVYTSESRALAAMEILVHVDLPDRLFLNRWAIVPAEIPGDLIERPQRVPPSWRDMPPSIATREFGAGWAREQRSAVLRVPSAVVLGEFNYLLNPAHPDFRQVGIGRPEPFIFDPRLH
jgi:RES domain-containing protein